MATPQHLIYTDDFARPVCAVCADRDGLVCNDIIQGKEYLHNEKPQYHSMAKKNIKVRKE
jgi:hypothetical protein